MLFCAHPEYTTLQNLFPIISCPAADLPVFAACFGFAASFSQAVCNICASLCWTKLRQDWLQFHWVVCGLQVVAGAGAINHQDLVDLAGKSFANLPTNPTTAEELVKKVGTTLMCTCHYAACQCVLCKAFFTLCASSVKPTCIVARGEDIYYGSECLTNKDNNMHMQQAFRSCQSTTYDPFCVKFACPAAYTVRPSNTIRQAAYWRSHRHVIRAPSSTCVLAAGPLLVDRV